MKAWTRKGRSGILPKLGIELLVESLAEILGQVELSAIGDQAYYVFRAVQHGGAMLAHFEVRFHS